MLDEFGSSNGFGCWPKFGEKNMNKTEVSFDGELRKLRMI